jgi:hypothetical protein
MAARAAARARRRAGIVAVAAAIATWCWLLCVWLPLVDHALTITKFSTHYH